MSRRLIHRRRWGLLFNKGAAWVGGHYSPYNRRLCLNVIPFVTFWVTTTKEGKRP